MSDREERKEAARARREAEELAAAQAASRKRRMWLVGGGVAVVAIVAGVLALALDGGDDGRRGSDDARAAIPARQIADLKAAARAAGGTFTSYDWDYGTGAHTTEAVKYRMNPPTNGPHNPVWAADGNYAGRTTPPVEQLVHSLEHGRIEIQYRPGLPAAQVRQLEALYAEDSHHVLLFENSTGMDADVAATAWGHGLIVPNWNDGVFDAVRAFRDKYRDKGPEYVA